MSVARHILIYVALSMIEAFGSAEQTIPFMSYYAYDDESSSIYNATIFYQSVVITILSFFKLGIYLSNKLCQTSC